MNDKVEREIFIRAPIERVFSALTDPSRYPSWGPERVEGRIAPGERPVLDFGPGGKCAVYVVALEAPRYFAYRWVQGVTDPAVLLGDPLKGPNTLVEFHVEAVEGGTRVRVVESGLSAVPQFPADIEKAKHNIGEGWRLMLGGLARHFEIPEPSDRVSSSIVIPGARARVLAALETPETWWYGLPPREGGALAFRWNLHGAPTSVELSLEEIDGATRVTATESGFDALPEREMSFRRAYLAWGAILGMLDSHLRSSASAS